MLGANDYLLVYADVYATFMNEETTESNEKFEEFMTIKRDMLLNIPFIADWEAVREKRKLLINQNLRRSNQKRRCFDYQPGDQVLVWRPGILRKLNKPFDGPFPIVKSHVNGNNVTIRRSTHVTERLNIRRIKPYKQPNV